eukprot:149279-Rhodomonas_salina.2
MCGTELAYAATGPPLSAICPVCDAVAHSPTIRLSYLSTRTNSTTALTLSMPSAALCGTDLAYAATQNNDVQYCRYALCGTDLAYTARLSVGTRLMFPRVRRGRTPYGATNFLWKSAMLQRDVRH